MVSAYARRVNSLSIVWNGDGSLSTWNTLPPFGGRSLEQDVAAGDRWERKFAQDNGIPLHYPTRLRRCPVLVFENLHHLRGKHPRLTSVSAVSRYVSRCGASVLQRIEGLRDLRELRKRAYGAGDEVTLSAFSSLDHIPPGLLGLAQVQLTVRTYHTVSTRLQDRSIDVGLPFSTTLILALCAGLAQSVEYVAPRYVELFAKHVIDFARYIEERVEVARRLTE